MRRGSREKLGDIKKSVQRKGLPKETTTINTQKKMDQKGRRRSLQNWRFPITKCLGQKSPLQGGLISSHHQK